MSITRVDLAWGGGIAVLVAVAVFGLVGNNFIDSTSKAVATGGEVAAKVAIGVIAPGFRLSADGDVIVHKDDLKRTADTTKWPTSNAQAKGSVEYDETAGDTEDLAEAKERLKVQLVAVYGEKK